jgi:hypothetical protein
VTRPEHRRAPRGTTTGEEGRFPHTEESAAHTVAIRAELVRRGEDASAAAVYRFALKHTVTTLGLKP